MQHCGCQLLENKEEYGDGKTFFSNLAASRSGAIWCGSILPRTWIFSVHGLPRHQKTLAVLRSFRAGAGQNYM